MKNFSGSGEIRTHDLVFRRDPLFQLGYGVMFVGLAGLKPATVGLEGPCSIHLNYNPKLAKHTCITMLSVFLLYIKYVVPSAC